MLVTVTKSHGCTVLGFCRKKVGFSHDHLQAFRTLLLDAPSDHTFQKWISVMRSTLMSLLNMADGELLLIDFYSICIRLFCISKNDCG